MQAAVFHGPHEVRLTDMPAPTPQAGEGLIIVVPVLKIPLPLPISYSKRLLKKISQQARSTLRQGRRGRRWVLLGYYW